MVTAAFLSVVESWDISEYETVDSYDISEYQTDYDDQKKMINTVNNMPIPPHLIIYIIFYYFSIFSIISFLLYYYIKSTFLETPPLLSVTADSKDEDEDDIQTQYNWLVPGHMNDEIFNTIVDAIAADAHADIDKLVIVTAKKTEARNITQMSVVNAQGWMMNVLEDLELFPHSDMREIARRYVVCSTPCKRAKRG